MSETCPVCNEELVARINGKTGEQFFGCSAFPKCKYSIGINEKGEPDYDREIEKELRKIFPRNNNWLDKGE